MDRSQKARHWQQALAVGRRAEGALPNFPSMKFATRRGCHRTAGEPDLAFYNTQLSASLECWRLAEGEKWQGTGHRS